MMTESEFLQYSDDLFSHIEDELDMAGADVDCEYNGNVLTITTSTDEQVIINRHTANQELWIAAKSGGYHFSQQPDHRWLSMRDNEEFYHVLNQVLTTACHQDIHITPFTATKS